MTLEQPWEIADVLKATGGRLTEEAPGPGNLPRITGVSTDTRTINAGALFVALTGEQFDGHQFVDQAFEKGAVAALIDGTHTTATEKKGQQGRYRIAVGDTLAALGDLAAFVRQQSDVSVVAVTGTNGKTTTKEMTAAVLQEGFTVLKTEGNFNNLIGLPQTLFSLKKKHDWAVLELGMNHPGEIARLAEICRPHIGIITNIAAGHLEGVKDLDGVMSAKGELLDALHEYGTAVLNIDDERLCRLADRFPGRVVSFGIENSAEVWARDISQTPSHTSFDLCWFDESIRVKLTMPGAGAVYNALSAAAVAYHVGLSITEVKAGLEKVSPVSGRMEVLTLPGGVHVINDTYNANPGSMTQAIRTLCTLKGNGRGLFISGDMLELGDHTRSAHRDLGLLVARSGISRLFATGAYAPAVIEGALEGGMDAYRTFLGSKTEIVEALRDLLAPGDWLLVKGSRMMAMEDVVENLKTDHLSD